MSVAWMPIGRACQQPTFTVSDVRRSQRTARNTSIKSRDAQDPVPILVTGLLSVPITESCPVAGGTGPGGAAERPGPAADGHLRERLRRPANRFCAGSTE